MRRLKNLIPDDARDWLNSSPFAKWVVLALVLIVGVALIFKGIDGVKNKRITGKNGRVYEGGMAQFMGASFVFTGGILTVAAILLPFIN